MNWLFWCDSIIFMCVQKLANFVNAFTGKDNYWMAWQTSFLGMICWITQRLTEAGPQTPYLMLAISFAIPLMLIVSIRRVQEFRENLRMSGVKADPLPDMIVRLITLGFLLGGLIKSVHEKGWQWFDVLGYVMLILVTYLIWIDKPPYSRSKAWEWLTKSKPVLQPSQVKS